MTHAVYEYVDTAVGTLFSILNTVGVVIVSTMVIHEGLKLREYAGAVILLVAIWVMLSSHVSARMHGRWVRALWLSILAAAAYGVAVTSEKYTLDHAGLSTYLLFGWGAEWFWAVFYALLLRIFRIGTAFLFILALVGSNNSSLVAVWSGLRVLIAALLGIVVLRERHFIKRKLEASLLALVAVGVLLW